MIKNVLSKSVLLLLAITMVVACEKKEEKKVEVTVKEEQTVEPFFKISLAQWSLNRAFRGGEADPMDFAKISKELGIDAIEYVSQLYKPYFSEGNKKEKIAELALKLKAESDKHGVTNVLIMVDREGDLASPKKSKRDEAIENHKMWIDAAAVLGCTSVRVNLAPTRNVDPAEWHANSVDGLGRLAAYGASKNINVIVENHGGISSDAGKLATVMAEINMPNCGTLPDFGNFCIDGHPRDNCKVDYNRYKGTEELMPYAKGVSAKSYDFDEAGNETKMDYRKLLQIVKDAGYTGYIGVEYEGQRLGEKEGVLATKELLQTIAAEMAK
ncbi:sugar phosphate isomerase/epimerase [Urechidicola sp. KH5]